MSIELNPIEGGYTIENEQVMVGKIDLTLVGDTAVHFEYEVNENHRGKGYAKAAADRLLKTLEDQGVTEVSTRVWNDNEFREASCHILESAGFQIIERDEESIVYYRKLA